MKRVVASAVRGRWHVLAASVFASALVACSALLGFEDLTGPVDGGDDGLGSSDDGGVRDGSGSSDGASGVLAAPSDVGADAPACTVTTLGTSFVNPRGIAVDHAGNVYVSGFDNLIRKIPPGGAVSTFTGVTGGGFADGDATHALFSDPRAIAVSLDGKNIYVADSANQRIRTIALDTAVTTTLAGNGDAGSAGGSAANASFNFPTLVAVSDAGTFVGEFGGYTIRTIRGGVVDPAGSPPITSIQPHGFAAPADPSVTPLFVTHDAVVARVINGGVTTLVGGAAGSKDSPGAAFFAPSGLVIQGDRLYVADTGNNRIRRIKWVAAPVDVTTLAGPMDGGASSGSDVGACAAARFASPQDVAADDSGNLYVADGMNNAVRKITGVDGQLLVHWTAPPGADATTSYSASASTPVGEAGSCTVVGTTSCVIGRLTSAASYTVQVTATTAGGTSAAGQSVGTAQPY